MPFPARPERREFAVRGLDLLCELLVVALHLPLLRVRLREFLLHLVERLLQLLLLRAALLQLFTYMYMYFVL